MEALFQIHSYCTVWMEDGRWNIESSVRIPSRNTPSVHIVTTVLPTHEKVLVPAFLGMETVPCLRI